MQDFVAQPVVIRTIERAAGNIVVEQHGGHHTVNGQFVQAIMVEDIKANPQHFCRKLLPVLEGANAVAFFYAAVLIDGKAANITLTVDQYALGDEERARYEAWSADCTAAEVARQAKEREHDRANNEGCDGYNPYRQGSTPTYGRRAK